MNTRVRPLLMNGAMTTSDGVTVDVNLELRFAVADPVFIQAKFSNPDQSETWEIGREMFAQVREHGCAGLGHVGMNVTDTGCWMFSLYDWETGTAAAIAVDARLVEAFLERTFQVSPADAEMEWLTAWSHEAAQWLAGAA